jgi:hypothetical protein
MVASASPELADAIYRLYRRVRMRGQVSFWLPVPFGFGAMKYLEREQAL